MSKKIDTVALTKKSSALRMVVSAVDFCMIVRVIRQLFASSPALYYENLGYDIVEGKSSNNDTEKAEPIWQNCGYWEGISDYNTACERLVQLVGDTAQLNTAASVVDVGFGFGEQGLYWAKHFQFQRMHGINITPFQVDTARRRALAAGFEHRLVYEVGDAVNLPIEDETVDRVIAVQSAFQFNTREAFFKEAFRVLKPGGILVLADMIEKDSRQRRFQLWAWITRRRVGWAHANIYDSDGYRSRLCSAGFSDVSIRSIAGRVFPGMDEYISRRYAGESANSIVIDSESVRPLSQAKKLWRFHYGIDDYVLVSATKKGA